MDMIDFANEMAVGDDDQILEKDFQNLTKKKDGAQVKMGQGVMAWFN